METIREAIKQKLAGFWTNVDSRIDTLLAVRDPIAFREAELEMHGLNRDLAD